MTEELTVQSLVAELREDGHRDLADALDYLDHSLAEIPNAEKVSDVLDAQDMPLPPERKLPFVIGVVAGTLLERKYPHNPDSQDGDTENGSAQT